jgi:regulation of enolase protein 1 (concanavalin A-like superfamily)
VCVLFGLSRSASAQLSSPWANRDIGSPAAAGSATESSGTFTVRGAGSDIGSSSDQFHFVYQTVAGDVDIRAQVDSIEYIHPWTKAGVMIRETLDATSRYASTFATPTDRTLFLRRVQADANSNSTNGPRGSHWVRVARVGQLFTSYVSADGSSWKVVGSETIEMGATVQVGLAVVSRDTSRAAMATFANVTVNASSAVPPPPPTSTSPPSAWTNRDIGSPALAGRSSESDGTFSVIGAGADIWGSSDQFQFMYQQVDGDVDIVARVVDVEDVNPWSKAGVMIRADLTASSAHAFMAGTPGQGWAFQRRPVAGAISVHSPGSYTAPPGWVRLVRSGNTFSGYESTDGTNWTLVGTETIVMPATVCVGLAVTSHDTTQTSTGTLTDVTITRPTTSNAPPTTGLLAPANGSTFTAPASIALSASASDSDGSVAKVVFYANGNAIGTDTTSPYSMTWSSVPAGTYSLSAVATDDTGATGTSATATVTVSNASNASPTVAITTPTSGATFTAPATITISATASDTDGTVAAVNFFANGQSIGSDTSSPFSISWTNVAAGAYSITAVARDDDGATTTSAAIAITIAAAPPPATPTSVAFTASADHATLVTSYSVAIYRASDPVTATPAASKNLGKPAPTNGDITVDISTIVDPLAAGSYYAVVSAVGSGGTSASAPSATFTK